MNYLRLTVLVCVAAVAMHFPDTQTHAAPIATGSKTLGLSDLPAGFHIARSVRYGAAQTAKNLTTTAAIKQHGFVLSAYLEFDSTATSGLTSVADGNVVFRTDASAAWYCGLEYARFHSQYHMSAVGSVHVGTGSRALGLRIGARDSYAIVFHRSGVCAVILGAGKSGTFALGQVTAIARKADARIGG